MNKPVGDETIIVQSGRLSRFWRWVFVKVPVARHISNMNIGPKLTLGFAVLVGLIFLVISLGFLGSRSASTQINQTNTVRVPIVLASSRAQASLLRMQADVHGYLALGETQFIEEYQTDKTAFETALSELTTLSEQMDDINAQRLQELVDAYEQWEQLPEPLFALRDDQLAREPAYKLLATEGIQTGGQAVVDTNKLISAQAIREASADNTLILRDMADFQSSFVGMLSGLRNYVTTQNRIYRMEYEANLNKNNLAWESLQDKQTRGLLTEGQTQLLATIEQNRDKFLDLPEQVFTIIEGEHSREDLYQFSTQVEPLTTLMIDLLSDITENQQNTLKEELNSGQAALDLANNRTLAFGLVALLLGAGMSFSLRENIGGPVVRLTRVAERIREGNLQAQALVESSDELGTLAATFNSMTGRLRDTLQQVRKEKKRADDLLHVVIPIGVELSSEKDFNRLLEKMLLEAKTFCRADAGTLYLRTDDEKLRFVIVRNEALQMAYGGTSGTQVPFEPLGLFDEAGKPNRVHVATAVTHDGRSFNIPNLYDTKDQFDFTGPPIFDAKLGYHTTSMLTIPLKNSEGRVIGVLQLLNAKDEANQIIPFDANLQQMMESFSSLAVAALEAYVREQALRQEIQQLRIEIDEAKLQQQVRETVETDFFQGLQSQAQDIRRKRRMAKAGSVVEALTEE